MLMNRLYYSRFVNTLRPVSRCMLVVILALGFAKAPLAYSCLPQFDQAGQAISQAIDQASGSTSPCHHPSNHKLPPDDPKRECCLITIDNGLRGAADGFVLSKIDPVETQQQPAIAVNDNHFLLLQPRPILRASAPVRPVAATFYPPYLATQRLRI